MKKTMQIWLLLLVSGYSFSQVGINTTAPNAQLDIRSVNPAAPTITDGVIIPKVDNLSAVPTVAQNGMMVFLTANLPEKPIGFYYWDNPSTSWKGIGGDKGWDILGNTGLNDAVNFIGTTDDTDIILKRANLRAGLIGTLNTSFGSEALNPASTGGFNTAMGEQAMQYNTSGFENAAFGAGTLWQNVAGFRNSAFGVGALSENLSGNYNTGIGNSALSQKTSGDFNTALGYEALQQNYIGSFNTGIGYQAGIVTTGSGNIAVGALAAVPVNAGNNQLSIGNVIYGTGMNTAAGQIAIGKTVPTVKLDLEETSNTKESVLNVRHANPLNNSVTYAIKTTLATSQPAGILVGMQNSLTVANAAKGFGINNIVTGSSSDEVNGTSNTITAGGTGIKSGTSNFIGGTSTGIVNGVSNSLTNTTASEQNGIRQQFNSTNGGIESGVQSFMWGTGGGDKYGVRNSIQNSGNGVHYGTYSYFTGAGTGTQYGSWNRIEVTGGGDKYGSYNLIPPGSLGTHYGVYSNATSATGYAGYFLGRVSIGTTAANSYILPSTRGTSNQIMQTDGFGNIGWISPGSVFGNAWLLGGNASVTAGNNSFGTNINIDLVFKRNNITSGMIGSDNTAFGYNSLPLATTGTSNTALGTFSMRDNTVGGYNTAVGYQSLLHNNNGDLNVAMGMNTLRDNISGTSNTSIGYESMMENETGNSNATIGFQALRDNISGSENIAIGNSTLRATTAGFRNLAVGSSALAANTGNYNVAIGALSLNTNITGSNNVAIGNYAGVHETGSNKLHIESTTVSTPVNPLIYGEFDNDLLRINGKFLVRATGSSSEMQVKNSNVYVHNSGNKNFSAFVAGGEFMVSSQEGFSDTAGIRGDGDDVTIWSASDNGRIVRFVDEDVWSGASTSPYGTAEMAYVQTNGAYFQVSDRNKKENIVKIENAISKIKNLNGYTYQFKQSAEEIAKGEVPVKSSGVIAQELELVLPEGIEKTKDGNYFVNYAAITPLLIEAVKAQQDEISELKKQNESQQKINEDLMKRLEKLESSTPK